MTGKSPRGPVSIKPKKSKPAPLYAEDFVPMKCETPGCTCGGAIFIHPRCHPEAGTWVSILDGVATVICRECRKLVVEIRIANRPASAN